MAQCFFRCPSGAGDWLLVELQGELTSHSHSSFQNLKLGTLRISADVRSLNFAQYAFDYIISMSVANSGNSIHGSWQSIIRGQGRGPQKAIAGVQADGDRSSACLFNQQFFVRALFFDGLLTYQAPDEANAPYEVAGVARKRVLFRNRPQPIVTAPLLLKQ
jgi:hypothetical protein